eukprot:CAMPEP_0183419608 /NCGR_PEP_ID=MMETSP0370-20130417/25910_1 /TAXON_ID=268820 /ORGANISM="Peridinium aciculiferum, Strain PAER-2" /LENGTH=47 /DNA_ID= /DNA_START= /DNA_END= /DNA_ORIENTATION=
MSSLTATILRVRSVLDSLGSTSISRRGGISTAPAAARQTLQVRSSWA